MGSCQNENPSPTRTTTANFFDLPKKARENIYKRLLILRSPIYIFQEPNSPIESFAPDRPFRWLALLRTNRQIHTESSAVLYGMNQFHLVEITPIQAELLKSFLACIGPANSASLSYLCVNFTVAERLGGKTGMIKLTTDSTQTLRLYRDKCAQLSTLETVVHYKNSGFFRESDDFLQNALPFIDKQLRTIPSLHKIIVRFLDFHGIPTAFAKDLMEGLGWIVVLRS
ncbi:hypothetical protein COCSADRAFT_34949 [Bipolaris sorokiniana ND90Pr]|uniref:Uncharacterized protein n=1 Tax=Cochliobolus sativus (strain ND90Pr / ATCC 201652) TaxID=665912 RepID=M2RI14_COCSN|nr:uncharacterized protein COCSADRAFT_34949 [Bipolaris sorokiniana ND90Pr]EMD66394.1 hypothetical protein COCSADRAFT_34949 [Bipolaris sorokiniana ND90Pr]